MSSKISSNKEPIDTDDEEWILISKSHSFLIIDNDGNKEENDKAAMYSSVNDIIGYRNIIRDSGNSDRSDGQQLLLLQQLQEPMYMSVQRKLGYPYENSMYKQVQKSIGYPVAKKVYPKPINIIDFDEKTLLGHLSSVTTCYSGLRNLTTNTGGRKGGFATETHTYNVDIIAPEASAAASIDMYGQTAPPPIRVTAQSISKQPPKDLQLGSYDDSSIHCVAYSSLHNNNEHSSQQEEGENTADEYWEVFVLLKTAADTTSGSSSSTKSVKHQPEHSSSLDDQASVAEKSLSKGTTNAELEGSNDKSGKGDSHNKKAASTISKATQANKESNNASSSLGHRTWIVLKCKKIKAEAIATTEEYVMSVPFKPLAPHLSLIEVEKINQNNERRNIVGVWIGSSDDDQLRLYVPENTITSPLSNFNDNNDSSIADITRKGRLVEVLASSSSSKTNNDTTLPAELEFDSLSSILYNNTFSSPIMGIDSITIPRHNANKTRNTTRKNYLFLACQNGSIHLISFQCHRYYGDDYSAAATNNKFALIFNNINQYSLIIDGPIVSLSSQAVVEGQDLIDSDNCNQITCTLHVIVGSLCGFVCHLTHHCHSKSISNSDTNDYFWNGPEMLIDNLWNYQINTIDSVLTVYTWNSSLECYNEVGGNGTLMVAVGSHFGRLLIFHCYEEDDSSSRYCCRHRLVWQCQLPHSIHGICHVPYYNGCPTGGINKDNDKKEQLLSPAKTTLLVTTQRSIHMFVETSTHKYSVENAVNKLDKLFG